MNETAATPHRLTKGQIEAWRDWWHEPHLHTRPEGKEFAVLCDMALSARSETADIWIDGMCRYCKCPRPYHETRCRAHKNAAPQASPGSLSGEAQSRITQTDPAVAAPLSARTVREWNDGAGLKSELDFLRSLAEILAPLDGGPADVKRALDAISVMRIALSAPRSSSAATKFPSVVYQLHDWCNRDFTGKDVIEDAQDLMEEAAEVIKRLSTVSATGDMERDAKRYRWLKATHFQTGVDSWIRTGDDLEEAIDAAMDRTSHACPYCTSDNPAIRSTYYDQTCEGCVKRMGRG